MASQVPPKKNTAFNLGLTLYKNDGTLIANPGTLTAKISKDFGDYADIGTTSEEDSTYGQIKLALTATEMNADVVMIYVVDNTSGCVPFTATIYTAANLMDDIKTDTAAILADTGTDGVVLAADAITAAKIADDAFSSEHFATGCISADAVADGTIDAGALAADCITSAKIADDALGSEHFADSFYTQLGIVAYGTAQSATSTTLVLAESSAFADDELNGAVVVITGGTGVGQSRVITNYTGSTDTAEVDAWTTTPSGTITYVVFAASPASSTSLPAVNLTQIAGSAVSATTAQLGVNVVSLSNDAITAASINTGALTADAFAADAIVAATLATGAITADALHADAVAEIADAVWDEASTGHTDAGKAGAQMWTDVDAILEDTGTTLDTLVKDIPTVSEFNARTLAAADYVVVTDTIAGVTSVTGVAAGGITASSIATGAIDADSLAADAVAEIADGVWDEATSGHAGAGSTGKALTDVLDDTGTAGVVVGSVAANAINAAAIATGAIDADALATDAVNEIVDQVWDETLGDHVASGSTGAGLTAAGAAGDPWSTAVPGAYGAGTAGYLIGTHINAPLDTIDANVDSILSDTGTDGVVVAEASKTGYALSTAGVDAIVDDAVEGAYTLRQSIRLMLAALVGKLSGAATTTVTIRDINDTTDRIVATVDADGNRTAVTKTVV